MELTQSFVAISLAIFSLFVGLPVWWQTTKVYRAHLPYKKISELRDDTLSSNIKLTLHVHIEESFLNGDSALHSNFKDSFNSIVGELMPSFNFSFVYNIVSNVDMLSLLSLNGTGTHSQQSIDKLSEHIEKQIHENFPKKDSECFYYNLVFLHMPNQFTNMNAKSGRWLLIGDSSLMVFLKSVKKDGLQENLKWVIATAKTILFPKFQFNRDKIGKINDSNSIPFQSSSGFDIAFTLANSDPFASVVDWNIAKAINSKLKPFLEKLSDLGPFSITSQILNFVDVGVLPKEHKQGGYFYSLKKLPLLINPLESNLNEYTSNNPILNFIVYIPQAKYRPLTIRSKGVTYMSFTCPRWGGVIIRNIESEKANQPHMDAELIVNKIEVDFEMATFISQFRELIGLGRNDVDDVAFAFSNRTAVMKWELDYLLLRETIENLKKSAANLNSLASLLAKIANIVIRDDIKELIENAVFNITESKVFLSNGQLRKAFLSSKSAALTSEKAFYDHSLLALLYFPDDQKYAIYLPLFLPIFIPLSLSFIFGIKTVNMHFRSS